MGLMNLEHRRLWQRGALVGTLALPLGLVHWLLQRETALDASLVYSFAISASIWCLNDPLRMALWPWLQGSPARTALFVLPVTLLGYALGTFIGDGYVGKSTLDLLSLDPWRFAGVLGASLAVSLGFTAYFFQQEKAHALALQASEAKLRLLQSQLEPHMLFNTLANLQALISLDPARAQTMLEHLIAYLRATLSASRSTTMHPLASEFERLRDYLALMHIRMGPRLQVRLELPEALACLPMPPLLLQPLVENAIRHGLEPQVQGGLLEVRAWQEAQQLVLEVSDTGQGLCQSQDRQAASGYDGSGFGLAQVRERLVTLYGDAGRLTLSDHAPSGTRAVLRLPLPPSP